MRLLGHRHIKSAHHPILTQPIQQHIIQLILNQHQKLQPTKRIKALQDQLVGLRILTLAGQQVNQQLHHIQPLKVQQHRIVHHIRQLIIHITQQLIILLGVV